MECIGGKKGTYKYIPPLWGGIYLFIKGTEVRKRVPKNKVPPPMGLNNLYHKYRARWESQIFAGVRIQMGTLIKNLPPPTPVCMCICYTMLYAVC